MIRRFFNILNRWPSDKAVLVACVVGLLALLVIVSGTVFALVPIVVVGSMSMGQGLLVLAFLLYGLSVVAEYRRDTGQAPAPPSGESDKP